MNNSKSKETITLLDLLSDTDTELSDGVLIPKKKKVKRKHRRGNAVKMKQQDICGCGRSDLKIVSLWLAAILFTVWLIALTWLTFVFYGEIKMMDVSIKSVIDGSESVPDALQKCHSLSRDLQNNQTIMFNHLSDLKLQINNFTTQLTAIQRDLHQVEEWFKAEPQLANVPTELNSLSNSVASFGSQIRDLSATLDTLKASNARVQDVQTTMLQNITNIKNTVTELSNITQRPQMVTTNETKIKTDELNAAILRLSNNLTHVNETLSGVVQWVAEDQKKDHKTLVLLQEASQAVNMTVISLQTSVSASIKKLNDQVTLIHTANADLSEKVKQLEQSHTTPRNSRSPILETQGSNKAFLKESIAGYVTTEQNRNGLDLNETLMRKPSTERSIETP
ncbi:uncharacterized protein LOC144471589 isoform X2 [Augochlora pura]